jgi:hypothetical protein
MPILKNIVAKDLAFLASGVREYMKHFGVEY